MYQSTSQAIIFTIVAIIFFVVTFVSHYFYEEYTWFKSVNSWIPWLQGFSWWPWKGFMIFISWWGWELMWLSIVVFYSKFNRVSSAFLITKTCEIIAFFNVLRMYFNDPAPYMHKSFIKAGQCDQNTFQSPSLEVGISAFAYSMIFYLAYDWIDIPMPKVPAERAPANRGDNVQVFENDDRDFFLNDETTYQKTKANDFSYWMYLALLIFLVFMIAFSDMYLGINSFEQVFLAMNLGYGLFCVMYYYFKDGATDRAIKVSERIVSTQKVILYFVLNLVFIVIGLIVAKVIYHYLVKDFYVNPKWQAQHFKNCGELPAISFFDKELTFVYQFLFLSLGVQLGITIDSILLGGTKVDYNQLRKSEDRNPLVGFIVRLIITVAWVLLCLWGVPILLKMLTSSLLFIFALPYFFCSLGMYSFLKYVFKILGATRPNIYPREDMHAVGLRKAD